MTQEDVIYLSSLRTQSLLCLQFKQIDLISISIQPNEIKFNLKKRVPTKITFQKHSFWYFDLRSVQPEAQQPASTPTISGYFDKENTP